jgi:hypothetical protein
MEIRIVDFVTVVASLASTGGVVAAGIRYLQRKDRDPKVIAGSLATVLIIVLVALVISRTTTITINNRSTIDVPPVLSLGSAGTAAATATPRKASAPLPTATPSLDTFPLLSDGVYNENVRLSCGDCDAPLLVTITQVTVNTAAENMHWTFTFYNHSGKTCSNISFNPLQVTDQNGVTFTLTGDATTDNSVSIGPAQSASLDGIFSFVAHSGAPYTLSAALATGYIDCGVTNYGPQVIRL